MSGNRRQGLTLDMVRDLLDADPLPKVKSYGGGPVRAVSAVGALAEEPSTGGDDRTTSKAGTLTFQLVEILSGDRWLLTCWHHSEMYKGVEEVQKEVTRRQDHDDVRDRVEHHWQRESLSRPGDMGVYILQELAVTYAGARANLYAWLESWELNFDEQPLNDEQPLKTERKTLTDLRGLLSQFRRRLEAFSQPTTKEQAGRRFPDCTRPDVGERVDDLTDRSLADLAALSDRLRSSMELLTSTGIAEQLRLAQAQKQRSDHLEDSLTLITSLLLVPTLIAGVFGANTHIPGEASWPGFALMLVLMAAGGGLTYAVRRRAIARAFPQDVGHTS